MDAFRQPKTSYYMFQSQRNPAKVNEFAQIETGPMVYVAHEMTPFSPPDVTVYSNCEEVRLTVYEGGEQYIYRRSQDTLKMPSPIITFPGVFDFIDTKTRSMSGRQKEVYLLAQGLIDGEVVAEHKRIPSRKPVKLHLWLDDQGQPLTADGSDLVTVIAAVEDHDGTIKRLNDFLVEFSIDGDGSLVGDSSIGANPIRATWGTAPVLLRAGITPGTLKVRAKILGDGGVNAIEPAEIEVMMSSPSTRMLFDAQEATLLNKNSGAMGEAIRVSDEVEIMHKHISELERQLLQQGLKQVEEQQKAFGEHP